MNKKQKNTSKNQTHTSACTFEQLEVRQLMTWIPHDMSDLALHYGPHNSTTTLYLNFDGGTINDSQAGNKKTIAAYQPPTGTERTQAIQDIIYRTSEIFSPFNVRVRIMRGAGNISKTNGNTTVFIGDNADNKDSTGHNGTYSVTPPASCDWPGTTKGLGHVPNSDLYDVAFVDPVGYSSSTQSNYTISTKEIAQNLSHEAGHTFGLVHVLTSPAKDLMSYDTSNNPAFLDQSFNITDLNYNGSTTTHTGEFPKINNAVNSQGQTFTTNIYKQNAFAYLRFALGYKNIYNDPQYHSVADRNTIASDYYGVLGDPSVITPASHPSTTLSNFGEYDVYTLNNVSSNPYVATFGATKISLAIGNPAFDPQILLYDSTGTSLLASVHGSSLQYNLQNNVKYQLVISGYLGDTAGAYTVNTTRVSPVLASTNFATTFSAQPKTSSVFSNTLVTNSTKDVVSALLA